MSRLIPIPLLICVWVANSCASRSFNILGICPSSSYSHQKPFQALMKALAARGHRVTVISTIPLKKPVENYEDIDVSFTYRTEDCTKLRHLGAYTLARLKMIEANELCEEQLSSRAVQELIRRKNQTFDAVIIEHLWYQCYYALVKHYNFPVMIGFLSVGNLPHALDSLGNPDDAVLNPDMGYPFTDRMTIRERLLNVLYTSWTRLYHGYWHLPRAQQIADKWIPGTPVREIDRNFSLLILGNNHILGYPKPLLPNIVEVHSLQIGGDPGALPKEIKDFLDNAEKGAVYFSLGSNLQTHQLPEKSLAALCNAFAAVEQRILWKHDGGVPFRSANVKFVKWAPQQAILAHDKVIAYIMQGGLQSLQEAVHYRVPVIAMPFFGDQHFNARKILDAQIGLNLNVDTLTNDTIVQVLKEIVGNPMYSRNINRMSEMLRDEQVKPMERAVWHVEHTLKFPNAKHLKYHGRDISWIAYYMIDLYACALIFIWVLYVIFTKVINKINHWARQYHLLRKVVNACATEFANLQLDKPVLKDLRTDEQLKKHTLDYSLEQKPAERALFLLTKGDEIQKLSAIQTLPSLLAGDTQLCITRVIPKMQQTLHTASTEFHMAASSTFKSILEQKLVNHVTFAQTFLQSILHSLDSRDPVVAHAWLETLLDVIELLPIDVIRQEILPLAVSRGQLSQPVNSRISCCKLMGKICTRFDALLIKNEVLPTVHSLCQDVNSEVRACICLQLRYVAEGIGAESVKPALLPSLVELASDEESMVRHASVQTIVHLLPQFQQDTIKGTIAPLVKKLCEGALKSDDDVVCVIAQEFGKLALGLQSSLTASEETWLLKYYQQLAQMGIQVAKKDNTKQDYPYMSNNPLVNGRYVECRRQCAFNIPAMFLFVSTAMGDLTALLPTFSELVIDPYYMVRRTIACGIHEVAKVFGSRCALLQAELVKLLIDNSEEVLQGLVPYLSRTLELLAQNQTIGTDNLDASGVELGKALLKCETEISSGNNWRLSVQMFQQLETLPTCFPSDFIYTYFVPVALNRALNARPIPVRLSAGRCLLVFLRHNLKSTQRIELHSKIYTEFARNRNSYVRLLFLRIMIEAMAIFSSVYFKEHFYATVLRLTEDPIANVRLKVVTILPVMKSMLRLPTDKKLLSQLEGNVRCLLNKEKDRDVIFLLTGVIQKLDSIEVRLEGQTNPPKLTKQENEDLKKYEEERRLAGLASGKTPAYSTQMQANPNLGKKSQNVQSKIGQGSRVNIAGEVLGSKGVRTPLDSSSKTSVQQSTTKSRQAGAMGLGMSDTSSKQGSRQSSSTPLRPMSDVLKASTSSNNLTSSWARLTSNSMLLTHPWERIGRSEPNISLNSASPSEGHDCMSQRPRCDCHELAERTFQTRLASDLCERGEYRANEPHCSCADANYSEAGGSAPSSSSREDDAHYPSTSDFTKSLLLTQLREDRHEFLQNVLLTREHLSSKDKAPDLAALRALTNAAHYNSCWAFSSMPEIPVSLLDDEFLVDAGIRIPAQLSSSQSTSKIPNLQDIIYRNRREGSADRTRRNSSGVAVGFEKGKTKRHSVEYEDCAKSGRMTSGVDRAKDNRGSGDYEDGSRSRLGRGKSEEPQFAAKEESRTKRYSGSCQGRARFGYEGNQGKAEDKSKRNSLILDKDKATKPPQSKSVIDRSKRHSVNYTSRFLEARDAKQQKMKRHSVEVTDYTPVERNSRLVKRYSTLDVNHNQGSSKIPLRSGLASGSRTAPTTRASSPVRSGPRSSYSRDSREDVRGSPGERFLGRFSSSDEEVDKICQKFLHCQTTPCSRAGSPRSRDSKLPVRLQRKKL